MSMLAIKGHATRGKEVIEILEMFGGKINGKLLGTEVFCAYYIDSDGSIDYKHYSRFDDAIQFTLEEFFEKFPYKIGERVRVPEYESEVYISKMCWDVNEVQYEVVTDEVEWYSAKELNKFNEPNKEKKINQMSLANCDLDEVEIVLGDKFELKIEDGKYYAVKKKPQYPKTYKECCKVLGYSGNYNMILTTDVDNKLFDALYRLKVCRDAYWKLYGEQMGLGKPWEPDWADTETDKYVIEIVKNTITIHDYPWNETNHLLAFPTKEMRDAFYQNFKVSIEQCKELL